jgi:uncharacterized protein DUF6629
MCWSPNADLVAGCAIIAVGALCIASSRRVRDLPLASLPVLLGVHQLIESVVWRNADNAADAGVMHAVGGTAVLLWMLIAFPLLPAFVPLAVLSAASHWSRFRIAPFALVGLATSAVLGHVIATGPVTAEPVGHTMRYGIQPIPSGVLVIAGYLVATIGSLLVSDQPEIRLLSLVIAVGALACYVLWRAEFASTWCALAAVASVLILHWLRRPRKRGRAPDSLRRSRIPAR